VDRWEKLEGVDLSREKSAASSRDGWGRSMINKYGVLGGGRAVLFQKGGGKGKIICISGEKSWRGRKNAILLLSRKRREYENKGGEERRVGL